MVEEVQEREGDQKDMNLPHLALKVVLPFVFS